MKEIDDAVSAVNALSAKVSTLVLQASELESAVADRTRRTRFLDDEIAAKEDRLNKIGLDVNEATKKRLAGGG